MESENVVNRQIHKIHARGGNLYLQLKGGTFRITGENYYGSNKWVTHDKLKSRAKLINIIEEEMIEVENDEYYEIIPVCIITNKGTLRYYHETDGFCGFETYWRKER